RRRRAPPGSSTCPTGSRRGPRKRSGGRSTTPRDSSADSPPRSPASSSGWIWRRCSARGLARCRKGSASARCWRSACSRPTRCSSATSRSTASICGRRAKSARRCANTPPPAGRSFSRSIRSPTPRACAIGSSCSAPAASAPKGPSTNRTRRPRRRRRTARRHRSRRSSLRLRKGAFLWLLEKEWRELLASRAWWVLLAVSGPLIGVSFISAVRTYAELSGYGGTAEGVGGAFSPLVGVWAPAFSACGPPAAFLLPCVAIRVMAGDRQSGALKLELQQPLSVLWRVAAKAIVLGAAWIVASAPAAIAVVLWRSYGGAIYAPELGAVILGHGLNAGLTIALASAAASLTDHPSTAAIVTLSVTVGTWIVNFVAAVQGGVWERIAGYT